MKTILIMHQTIAMHDAIGNDIECMYQILKQKFICRCFAENRLSSKLDYVSQEEAVKIIEDINNVVIYHHSVNWRLGEAMLKECNAKLIFRYHNITPPEFFRPYNTGYYIQCEEGRMQTERLIHDFSNAYWLSDSGYNNMDLVGVPDGRLGVCPPFHKIESWSGTLPDEAVMKKLINNFSFKVLFVGRIAPNKGHLMLLDILYAYCRNFGFEIKLYIIGKFDEGLAEYNQQIRDKIDKLLLQNNVEFIGEINDATLMAYYLGCDAFLCTSEHEGFCVPIIEAQKFKLPVIAKRSSAVPETLGDNQIILEDDTKEYAAAIHLLERQKSVRDFLRKNGSINFENRFTYGIIANTFKKYIQESVGLEL